MPHVKCNYTAWRATETQGCKQIAQDCYTTALRSGVEPATPWSQRWANYTTVCNWITNYQWQCSRVIKLQITTVTTVKLQNYKIVISNYCKLQITNQTLICCKYAVRYSYGGMVSCLGQNNHFQLSAFERPFEKRFTLCYRTVVCLPCLSLCNVGVLWPDGWRVPLGKEVRLGPVHCVRCGPSSTKRGHSRPQFSAHVCCRQTGGWMPLGTEVGLGAGHNVLNGDPAPPKGAQQPPPIFRPMSIVAKRLEGSRCHLLRR